MKILSGSAHRELASKIAIAAGMDGLTDVTVDRFPDGESFVQINENIRGKDVYIVQPTCPDTNQNFMELCVIVDAARRASAGFITAVMPFYGYARQDRKDKSRVPITAKLVANLLTAAGVNRVITMDLHASQIQGFFDIPVDHLYASPVLIKHIKDSYPDILDNLVIVSPDVGAAKMGRSYSRSFGVNLAIVNKHRVTATEVEATNVIGDVDGKNVLIIDDMTETAGTLCAAAQILQEHGAQRIFAGVSHGVLNEAANAKLDASPIERLFTTDSVPMAFGNKVSVASVGDLLGRAVRRIHDGESVSSLFDIG